MSLAAAPASTALSLDGLAEQVRRVWADTKAHQIAAWEGYLTTGHLLRSARARFPSDKEYGRWFAAQGFPFSTQWAGRLIALAAREPEVRALLETAVSSNPPGVNAVYAALGSGLAPLMTSNSPDWHTPREVVESVVTALGGIDLDPCSNDGEPNVPAAQHYTVTQDGLEQPWRGRVYMNPPYGREIGQWIDKLATEYEQGNVTEAVALLPARTDTDWWLRLPATAICFVHGRLRFSDAESGAPFPSVAAYLGPDVERFGEAFAPLGLLYQRIGQ